MQEAMHDHTTAFLSVGLPQSQATAASMGLLHARLMLQSVVNAFVDTFRYQAALGVVAFVLVMLLGREKTLVRVREWIVEMVR